ncbi:MAG TPA: hypothetical protein VF234_04035, partial [Limnochordia bacterium]
MQQTPTLSQPAPGAGPGIAREPALVYAIPLFCALAAAVLTLPEATYLHSGWRRGVQIAAALWLFATLYLWAVPAWRDRLERWGPLRLTLGFVVVTALALSLAAAPTAAALPGLFIQRLVLLGLPFAAAAALRTEPGRPQWCDAAVFFYAFLLVRYGWLDVHVAGAIEPPIFRINLGYHGVIALIAAYYFGFRRWATLETDWRLSVSDLKTAALGLVIFLLPALPFAWLTGLLVPHDPPWTFRDWWQSAVYLLAVVPVIEEYTFRGVLLVGLRHLCPQGRVGDVLAVIAAAVIF